MISIAVTSALMLSIASAVCPGQEALLPNPSNPAVNGPYPVGTALGFIEVASGFLGHRRNITVEIWYPAVPGSEKGKALHGYDIREHMPEPQRKKLAEAANETFQPCDCYAQLPIAVGKFPVVIYAHGAFCWRTTSLHQQTHWASRGFVVVAADHPGYHMYDWLNALNFKPVPYLNQEGDLRGIFSALANIASSAPSLGGVAGHLDLERVAVAGWSAGTNGIEHLGDLADVMIAMAGTPSSGGSRVKSSLVLAAQNDTALPYSTEKTLYNKCPATPKRFASIVRHGHQAFSDFCILGKGKGGFVKVMEDHGIRAVGVGAFIGNNGCTYMNKPQGPHYVDMQCAWYFTNYATSGVLEEVLKCDTSMGSKLQAMVEGPPDVPTMCPKNLTLDYFELLSSSVVLV